MSSRSRKSADLQETVSPHHETECVHASIPITTSELITDDFTIPNTYRKGGNSIITVGESNIGVETNHPSYRANISRGSPGRDQPSFRPRSEVQDLRSTIISDDSGSGGLRTTLPRKLRHILESQRHNRNTPIYMAGP